MTHRRHHGFTAASFATTILILLPSSAWAGNECSVSAVTHAFGAYDTLNAKDSTSDITITCTSGGGSANVPYNVKLSAGPGSYALRSMTGPAATVLNYNLYLDSARTSVWGDGSAGTGFVARTMVIPGSGTASFIHTLYGRIPALQNVRPGAYATTSNITVTVEW